MKFSVNMNLLPMKAQYFLWNAGTAPIVPFLSIYARQLGFSSVVVGAIYTVLPILGMLAKPLFGAVADKFRLQKTLFVMFQLVTAIAFFVIQFIPEIPVDRQVIMACDGETYFRTCGNENTHACNAARVISEAGSNDTINCQFDCIVTNKFLAEVCRTWNATQYCTTRAKPNVLTNYTHDILLNVSENSTRILNFKGEVPMKHTQEVGNCLHFRVKSAEFEGGISHVPYCNMLTVAECQVQCTSSAVNDVIARSTFDGWDVTLLYQFWLFFLFLVISWVGMAVVVSVGDAICFEMLGDHPSRYGQQRLWGAVGWGIFSIISGVLVDEFSQGKVKKDYTSMFYLMLVMLTLDMLVSSRLQYSQTKVSSSILRDVTKLFNIRILVFIFWCILVGLSTGLLWQFLFWHLEDLASLEGCDMQKWIKTLEGLVMGVQCFGGELPFFFLSGWILKKIGHIHAMSLVLGGFGFRFMLYSILTNPWWCLPIELLQGLTFGIFYATMASYASIVAPPGTETTIQGLVGAIFEGIGVSMGSFVGGVLFKSYGGSVTFQVFGIVSLVMCVVHFLIQHFYLSRRPEYNIRAKDFGTTAHYALPNEAILMLGDHQDLTPS